MFCFSESESWKLWTRRSASSERRIGRRKLIQFWKSKRGSSSSAGASSSGTQTHESNGTSEKGSSNSSENVGNSQQNEGNVQSFVPNDSEGEEVIAVEPPDDRTQNHTSGQQGSSGSDDSEQRALEKAEYENNVQEATETFDELILELSSLIEGLDSDSENANEDSVLENSIEMDLIVPAEEIATEIQAGEENAIEVTAGDPVVKTTGQFVFSTNDFSVKYGVNNFSFSRIFLSSSHFDGAFGSNWFCPLDSRIVLGTNATSAKNVLNRISLLQSEIEKKIQNAEKSSSWTKKVYSDSRVKPLYDSYLQKLNLAKQKSESIIQKSEANKNKNSQAKYGNLEKAKMLTVNQLLFVDSNGSEKIFVYDDATSSYKKENDKKISSIKLEQDSYKVCYKNGFTKVFSQNLVPTFFEDRYGSRLSFTHDAKTGRIVKIEHNGKSLCNIFWGDDGELTFIEEGLTKKQHHYEYKKKNLAAYSCPDGNRICYDFDSENDITKIKKSDEKSVFISYVRDSKNHKTVSSVKNEEGGVEKFVRNPLKNELQFFDADGCASLFKFSDSKKILEELKSDGTFIKRTYNSFGDVACEQTVFGNKNFYYDKNRNLIKTVYSDSSYEEWTYCEPFNLVSSYRNRDGNVTKYFYDDTGFCSRIERGGKTIFSFTKNSWGGIKNSSGINGNQNFSYNDFYKLSSDSDGVYKYDFSGELISFATHEGYSWKINRSDDNKIVKITSPFGIETQLFFDDGKNCSKRIVWDSGINQGFAERYYYDKRNLCVLIEQKEISSPNDESDSFYKNCESYSYTKAGRLKTKTLFNNGKSALLDGEMLQTEYVYDKNGNICEIKKSFLNANGKQIGKVKNTKVAIEYISGTKRYIVSDDENQQTIITCNALDSILSIEEKDGMRNQFSYSPAGKLLSEKNLYGGKIFYSYDAANDFISEQRDELGNITRFTRSLDGKQISSVKNNGYAVQYFLEKSAQGSLIKKVTPTEIVETFYDSLGRIKSCIVKDCVSGLSVESQYSYDSAKRKVNVKTGAFSETFDCASDGKILLKNKNGANYKYDFFGNVTEISLADEIVTIEYNCFNLPSFVQSKNRSVLFCYDVDGKLLKAEDALGVLYDCEYDLRGRLIFEKNRGEPKRFYKYDSFDFLTLVKENEICVEKRQYENNHKKVFISDAHDCVRTMEFDSYGRAVKETNRLGKTASVLYDDKKNSKTYTSFSGKTVTESFLQNTRELVHNYSDGRTEKVSFDSFGNIVSSKSPASFERYSYLEGTLLSSENCNGIVQSYRYNSEGQVLSLGNANDSLSFKYNSAGKLERLSGENFSRQFFYNSFGEEIFTLDSDKNSIEKSYDDAGRLLRIVQKDYNKNIIFAEENVYDAEGRICAVFHTDGSFSLYTYDENGRLCSSSLPYCEQFFLSAQNEFGECGSEKSAYANGKENISLPPDYFERYKNFLSAIKKENCLYKNSFEVWTEKYFYDLCGNRIQKHTALGTLHYSYDKENRLSRISENPNSKKGIEFFYDDDGNLIAKKSVYKTEYWKYNASARITEYFLLDFKNDSAKKLFYDYDALGRLSYVQDADGLCVNYVYKGTSFSVLAEYTSTRKPRSQDFTAHTASFVSSENVARYAEIEKQNKFSSAYKHLFSRCAFNRFFACAGDVLCFQKNEKTSFADSNGEIVSPLFSYCTDQRGSVRTATTYENDVYELVYGSYGNAFVFKDGNEVESADASVGGITYQFNGKSFDSVSASYNYGLRSYDPFTARFSCEDPIRDGSNWYTYCAGDPINFVDKIGLALLSVVQKYNMSNYSDYLGLSKDTRIREQGCYVTTMANILWNAENYYGTTFNVTGEDHVLAINNNKDLFEGSLLTFRNGMDSIFGSENWDYFKRDSKEPNKLFEKIKECEKSDTGYMIAGIFDLSGATDGVTNHMVLINGYSITKDAKGNDKVIFDIVGTSNGDAYRLKDASKKLQYCLENLKEIRIIIIQNYNATACAD